MKVPSLTSPTIKEAAMPVARVSTETNAEAFGVGQSQQNLNQATNQLASTATNFFEQERKKADDARAFEAEIQASELQHRIELSVKDKKGKNALEASELAEQEWTKGTDEFKKSLSTQAQKDQVDKIIKLRKSNLGKFTETHTHDEMEKYNDGVANAYIENMRNEAVNNYKDPERRELSMFQQEQALMKQLKNKGIESADAEAPQSEMGKKMLGEVRSKTHASVIEKMLVNDEDMDAKAYFEANKDLISDSTVRTAIEKDLEEGSLRGESQRQSDAIFSQSQGNMSKAMADARKIEDPKLRDETLRRVKDRFTEQKLVENDRNEKNHLSALNAIDSGGDPQKTQAWKQFTSTERSALLAYADKKKTGTLATDWGEYYKVRSMAVDDSNTFKTVNLMEYRSKMADSEFKQLVDLQTQLRGGDGKADKLLNGFRTADQIVTGTLKNIGINPNAEAGKKDAKKAEQFKRAVEERVLQIQKQTGKEASTKEIQEIADDLALKATVKGSGMDIPFFGKVLADEKRMFEVEKGEQVDVAYEDIPSSEKRRIEGALKKRGIEATADSILDLYIKKIKVTRGF